MKLLNEIRRVLITNRRNLGIALSCCALGLLLWGRLLLKDVQRSAVAVPAEKVEVVVRPEINNEGLRLSENGEGEGLDRAEVAKTLKRDLFSGEITQTTGSEKTAKVTPVKQKSDFDVVDHRDKAIAVEKQIVLEARMLRLTSTVTGGKPEALINGTSYTVSDDVNGFKIVRIGQDHIMIERRGYRLKLKLVNE